MIDPETAERIMLLIGVAGPLVGLILGTVLGAHERCAAARILQGTLIGVLGSVVYGAWRVYGIVSNRLGPGSFCNLCLQMIIFAICGVGIGAAMFKISLLLKRLRKGKML